MRREELDRMYAESVAETVEMVRALSAPRTLAEDIASGQFARDVADITIRPVGWWVRTRAAQDEVTSAADHAMLRGLGIAVG